MASPMHDAEDWRQWAPRGRPAVRGVRRFCCMPTCTPVACAGMTLLCVVLSVGVAYAIKAAWMHADQTHAHLQPPPPPPPPPLQTNGTAVGNATTPAPTPTTWVKLGAWDRRYYAPAFGVSLLLVGVVLLFLRYLVGVARGCGCCQRLCQPCCARVNDRYRALELSVEASPHVSTNERP